MGLVAGEGLASVVAAGEAGTAVEEGLPGAGAGAALNGGGGGEKAIVGGG